jgi:hypothetical protein
MLLCSCSRVSPSTIRALYEDAVIVILSGVDLYIQIVPKLRLGVCMGLAGWTNPTRTCTRWYPYP